MNTGRVAKLAAAAATLSLALAACGGGGGGPKAPSALDPANMVPPTAVAYADVTIRPQGSIRADLVEAIDAVAGKGSAAHLEASFDRSAGRQWRTLKTWAGQHLGVALTAVPSRLVDSDQLTNNVAFVVPTDNGRAARRWLAANIHASDESWKLVGDYAIFGGKSAVSVVQATTAKSSLATVAGFESDMAQLGHGELFTAYLPLHQLYEQLLPLLKALPDYSASTLAGSAKQAPPGSSLALGMSALPNQFRLDVVEHGMPQRSAPATGVATDVSTLPASSWLAITLGGALTRSGTVSKLAASVSKSLSTLQAARGIAGRVPNGPLQFVVKDLLPALGPAELSVSGSSSTTLQAGLVMDPVNKRAGARLAAAVKHMVAGLPISAGTVTGRLVVSFGFSKLAQLLNPSSKLAGNPTFKHALAQLPAGARADVYVNFAGIAALASLDPSAGSSSAMAVLRRLDYLIAGGTHSHFRLVLATH